MTDEAAITPPSPPAREAFRRRLPMREKALLAVEIVAAYAKARWWLRQTTLGETVANLRGGAPTPLEPDGDQLLTGVRLGRAVGKGLGALPADSRCLVRSLVLVSLLAKRGIAASLVIGVKSQPRFEAHAWVECAGVPLLPAGDPAYARLTEL